MSPRRPTAPERPACTERSVPYPPTSALQHRIELAVLPFDTSKKRGHDLLCLRQKPVRLRLDRRRGGPTLDVVRECRPQATHLLLIAPSRRGDRGVGVRDEFRIERRVFEGQ